MEDKQIKFAAVGCFSMGDSFKETTTKKGDGYYVLKTEIDKLEEIDQPTGNLSINTEMSAIDKKDRKFYDNLSEDEKKKFGTFTMIRWASCVYGIPELQAYYLRAANIRLNRNYFAISDTDHKKLNWLGVTTISPGMGNQRHQWIAAPKKNMSTTKVGKFLSLLYPGLKADDIALMEQLNDVKTCKAHAEELGMSKEEIKKLLG